MPVFLKPYPGTAAPSTACWGIKTLFTVERSGLCPERFLRFWVDKNPSFGGKPLLSWSKGGVLVLSMERVLLLWVERDKCKLLVLVALVLLVLTASTVLNEAVALLGYSCTVRNSLDWSMGTLAALCTNPPALFDIASWGGKRGLIGFCTWLFLCMASISISTSIACWSTAWLCPVIVAKVGVKGVLLIWLLLIPSVTVELLMLGDADCRVVFVREVVVVVVVPLLGVSEMAVILTKLTGLTWQVVITVLMGLLAIIMVEGELSVMAVVDKGFGRIWA